jgi:exodeoxyribonuclease III
MAPGVQNCRGTVRIVSWNISSITARLGDQLRSELEAFDADVICLQELGIRNSDAATVAAMALPGFALHVSLPTDPRNVRFRGGRAYGVATYVRDAAATAFSPEWDREGRVVVALLGELAIVNVYAVNGTDKPYFDNHGQVRGDRHEFKRRFQDRIVELGLALRARGHELVMIGDWNVSRTAQDIHPRLRTAGPHVAARSAFNDHLMPALDVVDAFRELHPEAREYTWFNKRSYALDAARVDFALVSRGLMPSVRSATIDRRPEVRRGTDHAPLAIELSR